jgi:glyoxalase superfamily protein
MGTTWQLAIDCADPTKLARFWALALNYEEGIESAHLVDPDGVGPSLYFHQVPESKIVKNRLHVDIKVGGGRDKPHEERWPRVLAAKERLTAAGATVVREDWWQDKPDHLVMADPEGNEFCLV